MLRSFVTPHKSGIKCKACVVNETDNPDAIFDDCKLSIISSDDIPPDI